MTTTGSPDLDQCYRYELRKQILFGISVACCLWPTA